MAGDMNRATLMGRLGADPEGKTTQSGNRVVNLRIATSETWRDKQSGERREKTQWHRVVIWNEALGKIAEQYLKKGHRCLVEGAIETRKWTDQSGAEKYTTEIVLQGFDAKLILLGAPQGSGGNSSGGGGDYGSRGSARNQDMDDDIPF